MKSLKPLTLFLLLTLTACSPKYYKQQWTTEQAPEYFKVRFETTHGNFEVEAYRKWSPLGADRLYQLIKHRYYTNTPIQRVVPDFVMQFGGFDTVRQKIWEKHPIDDEPVVKKNTAGTISFANEGKKSRQCHLFINLKDNPRLDNLKYDGIVGYRGVAAVTKGIDVVAGCYSYGDGPNNKSDSVKNVLAYFKEHYPKMDYIKKAYFIK